MSDPVTVYCANILCQAPNLESHQFCQRCRTPLVKRYLWVAGDRQEPLPVGHTLGDRYRVKQARIVLDTQPAFPPESPLDLLPEMEPYLRLIPYLVHLPQVYGVIQPTQTETQFSHPTQLLLLEQIPIQDYKSEASEAIAVSLLPDLPVVWQSASALRQLNWLWQLAQLWQPFREEQVASTLLQPDLLRVEQGIVRILQLQLDPKPAPTLADLGQLWQRWQPTAQPQIREFLLKLSQNLVEGRIPQAEFLVAVLDQAVAIAAQGQSRQIQVATLTDQGPSRQQNEDACYPPSGTVATLRLEESTGTPPLVIVCDGIGGHEGGEVASNLAIATLQQELQPLLHQSTHLEPTALTTALERAALVANDRISQQNDQEQRQERQRMGTTLVMALARGHELYLTHVGDSRAYRISATGCRQVTLDDDLAAREVRLGYAIYREALQQMGSGALVQALGMNASSLLHPTVQRFILDQDCLFLLCSDGLSDNDRVEQHWQTELLPILEGKVDLATATQRLVQVANTCNGHDNVTVALLACQITPVNQAADGQALDPALADAFLAMLATAPPTPVGKTRILQRPRSLALPALSLLMTLGGLLLGGGLAYWLIPDLAVQIDRGLGVPTPTPSVPITPLPELPVPSMPASPLEFSTGTLIQVSRTLPANGDTRPTLQLLSNPDATTRALGSIPVGTVLQIVSRQVRPNQADWLELKVCSTPAGTQTAPPSVLPGKKGWIAQAAIAPLISQEALGLTPSQLGECAPRRGGQQE